MKTSVRQKVLEILQRAMTDHLYLKKGHILYAGKMIFVRDGFVAQSIFADPTITGSTEGKRRLRELRADVAMQEKYIFEMRHQKNHWEYRILPHSNQSEFRLKFAEV
jgi:hypothetical protein